MLKGFGAYETFVAEVVEPYVAQNFAGNPTLERAIDQVFTFVAETNVSGLGISGLLFLTYTSVSLLATIEAVLNELWCFEKGRGIFRRVTDYVTLVVITPILVLVAVTFGAAAQSSSLVLFLRHQLALGPVIDVMLRSTSVLGACLAMTALFLIMPNGRVRPISALIGGTISGVLWQGALILHVDLQVGVARYNALYSGFGALPIFLVWVYISWLAVLLGAEVAAGHQNEQTLRQRLRAREVDQALEEALGIAVMARATRSIVDQSPRPSVATLAADLGAPPQVITKIVQALSAGGFLVAVKSKREDTFIAAKDIDAVRVRDVLAALRHRTHRVDSTPEIEREVDPAVTGLLQELDTAAGEAAPSGLTLRELAASSPPTAITGRER